MRDFFYGNCGWIIMWISLSLIVGVFALGICYSYNNRLKTMAENGYCEVQLLGTAQLAWQKCNSGK